MALCVIYPVPGLLHSKGKEGNLKQCQPGTILPPELGLQDLQEPQRTVITNYSWLASVVAYERISFTRLRREWDSNPQSCRPDGNKSDALTTRPRRYAYDKLLLTELFFGCGILNQFLDCFVIVLFLPSQVEYIHYHLWDSCHQHFQQ